MSSILEVRYDGKRIAVGSELTTQKSGVVGTVVRIDGTRFAGMYRVQLLVDGVERWTTYQFDIPETVDEDSLAYDEPADEMGGE
jgi:hypothetical protein